ncbi:uncharacterized protein LOC129857165 isoform X2 [Salvelinus fontinalis]|uniref:uncharacterized protein LOC129857165 isoform X2 n=1 Tax=Salvelinus fontinalis TaxID=8038 RepID=UPI002485B59C|nr:uncharacterized protein LOC129857165 isoform X2 [Salvelinus fontinalis]
MKATDEWANKTMKHGRYATLVNAANKLVGVYSLRLLSKRKKDNILSSTVLCPHSGMMNQTSMAAIQMLYEAIVKVAINTHTPTLQPSNPPPIAAQELSDTVAPQETSYTLILNQVEPPISPTTQETSFTRIPNQVKPPITPTTQETSYTHTKPKKTGRKSCHLVTLKKPSKSMSMTVNSIPSNPIQPHPTPSYPIQPRPRKRKYDYMQKSVQCIRGKQFSLFSRFLPIELQRRVRSRR